MKSSSKDLVSELEAATFDVLSGVSDGEIQKVRSKAAIMATIFLERG